MERAARSMTIEAMLGDLAHKESGCMTHLLPAEPNCSLRNGSVRSRNPLPDRRSQGRFLTPLTTSLQSDASSPCSGSGMADVDHCVFDVGRKDEYGRVATAIE
jgi:hypothetical protein